MSGGHRAMPHTADIAVEAWGDSREECLAEAVRGLVESFADIRDAPPGHGVDLTVTAQTDEDLLVEVLQEVIYQIEVHGRLVVDVSPGAAGLRLSTVPAESVEQVGAMPKAVTAHDVRFGETDGTWRAHVVVDV
ncbi:archease [Nonomuraea sp. 10N515B]